MLQVARLAPRALGDATEPLRTFFDEQLTGSGAGRDRAGAPDLYYTVFALEGLIALQAEVPGAGVAAWLARFGAGGELDLVHLACLARAWAALPREHCAGRPTSAIVANLARFRAADGGFANETGADRSTVYHTFLAHGAHEDLGRPCPGAPALAAAVLARRAHDGGFANAPGLPAGVTPVTAAAVTLLRALGEPPPAGVADWLLARLHAEGGFLAAPRAPMPDLLSTATALHALCVLGVDLTPIREACLDFIDTLWTGRAFCGQWADDVADAEYTWYALLALGHLSV